MDKSTTSVVKETTQRVPLGSSSFNSAERQLFGQNMRLAMGCIEGKLKPVNIKAIPANATDIRQRLMVLSQDITSSHADLLELLVRFDELEGWKSGGASHCAAWMNLEIGISLQLGWEYLRVGRKLRLLPTTTALFRAGKLSWSKVRLIVNVADADNEKTLCHAALDGSVSEVKRLCDGYRWQEDDKNGDEENNRAMQQWQSRSFTWQETPIGSTRIQLTLPPDIAQAFLNSVEHSLSQLDNRGDNEYNSDGDTNINESSISQRRADAAVLMAENSLQLAGREIATADRYQVIVSVDASDMTTSDASDVAMPSTGKSTSTSTPTSTPTHNPPSRRPTVKGAGPIARETARRIACDCSVSTHLTSDGELMDIGRKSRIWPNVMSRAIKARDQHCQWPGCTRTHHLPIHHLKHWADGGETKVSNGVSLCQFHHSLVHEGGYTIEWASGNERRMCEQFEQQRHTKDLSLFDFEKNLRNDRESFDTIRKLSPTRYRFRVKNAQGVDVRALTDVCSSTYVAVVADRPGTDTRNTSSSPPSYQPRHSIRMECGEPECAPYYFSSRVHATTGIAEFLPSTTQP